MPSPRRKKLLPFDRALARTLSVARRLPPETVPLRSALGRVLHGDVRSRLNIPPFDRSAMDGYAVRVADLEGASRETPAVLEVAAVLAAGHRKKQRLPAHCAARIMTGAALPPGAEAVVMQEYTERRGDRVRVFYPVEPGENCGQVGEDVARGQVVLADGRVLGPADLGMLGATGRERVRVTRRPRVAVISTGNEVVAPGGRLGPGQIHDANGYSLLGLSSRVGADARFLGIVGDRPGALKKKLDRARKDDAILLSGGVSVGDYDLVRRQLLDLGFKEVFWRVAMKPGKPVFLGKRGKQVVFGLPGNPVSVMVVFEMLVRPYFETLVGKTRVGLPRMTATLAGRVKLRGSRRKFLRGLLAAGEGRPIVIPYVNQKSGVLRSMVECNVLIDVPGEFDELVAGDLVEVLPMEVPWETS